MTDEFKVPVNNVLADVIKNSDNIKSIVIFAKLKKPDDELGEIACWSSVSSIKTRKIIKNGTEEWLDG